MKQLSEENETLTHIVYNAGRSPESHRPTQPPAQPLERIHQSISRISRRKIRLNI